MVDLKPIIQVFLLILGSMAVAWILIEVRDHIWPRPVISLPYDNQAAFERAVQAEADELEATEAHVRHMRAITEAKLVGQHVDSQVLMNELGEYLTPESD